MTQPDFAGAQQHALGRLAQELAPDLFFHSLAHTRDDVLPAVERLAPMEGVEGTALQLLRTAACYHDIGFIERRIDHEFVSVRIATETLPQFGFLPEQIEVIGGIIMATRLPQSPHNLLEELMADADLDSLGRSDFFSRSDALRAELAAYGSHSSDEQWYSRLLQLLQEHRYFTNAARTLHSAQKQENIAAATRLLAQSRVH